ncbi:putative katanin p60 ATPase-containing subunit [Phytophthora cinnamomi]|uniref:putative katanin p60 ATPase-containing subunit n=1 Tax=Phytophthora cinnamomi TaxID=4785 RepID=UPI00355A983D|nr:putative katanin p60 ATPase-containing subunit [Phytophthora cinnamomi]
MASNMAAAQSAQHALLRARELCLLGDYERGIPEFRAVRKTLETTLGGAPEAREFLKDLQREYRAILEYRGTLQDLALAANKVQDAQRRSRAARERKRRQQQEEQAAEAIAAEPAPVQRWEKPQPARRPRTEQVVATAATRQRARERQVPLWMHRGEPRATTVARARQLQQSRKSTAVSTTRMKRTSLENKSRNVAKRSGESSISSTDAKQRKTGQGPRPSKRRESVQSTASSTNNELSQETMSGRVRYSNLAKENDWVDRELIEAIERDIVDHGEKITFENIAGLEHTKQLLQETVMLPQIAPHLFTDGLLKPCNGVLMFGPPGTGKTLLAKAVAHECGTTFFNVSASTLSSKYRGDSEKMVRILFDMARYYEPSIIFMDEIDAIASARGAATEHEASRRVKTELLVQINGVSSGEHEGSRVMLLAATNLPWELDEAMRRRLTKRVYIPLPGAEARRALFEFNMGKIDVGTDVKLDELVDETEGYSGDDITNVCETAKRMPVKRVYTPELLLKMRREIEAGEDFRELETERLVVTKADFAEALANVSKSVGHDQLRRFEEWEADFGSK